jgi:hypothetical protein
MENNFVDVSVKGKLRKVPAVQAGGTTIVITGRGIKMARIYDEDWRSDKVEEPDAILLELKRSSNRPDVFTFAQKLPETQPKFSYHLEWDNFAAVRITTFDNWWESVPQETRKNVRRAGRRGVTTQVVSMDDRLALQLKNIYDEMPVRQGRKFWHFGKDVETVKRENSSYAETSEFIGAFIQEELIGLLKMVFVGSTASIMQIISQNKHYDKRPANALLAKAIEICAAKHLSHFVYGQYIYGNNNDAPLTEFKRRNGFEQILVPRYYVPLTPKGRLALKLNLHLGVRRFLPRKLESALLSLRSRVYEVILRKPMQARDESATA